MIIQYFKYKIFRLLDYFVIHKNARKVRYVTRFHENITDR